MQEKKKVNIFSLSWMHSLAFDMLWPRGLNGNYFKNPTEINKTNQHN